MQDSAGNSKDASLAIFRVETQVKTRGQMGDPEEHVLRDKDVVMVGEVWARDRIVCKV